MGFFCYSAFRPKEREDLFSVFLAFYIELMILKNEEEEHVCFSRKHF